MQKGSYTVVEKRRRVLSLRDRFWITSIFTLPLLILMIGMWAGFVSHPVSRWGTFLATTPIMLVAVSYTHLDAFEHILCGASMVQIGTTLHKEGVGAFERITAELKAIMEEKGYQSLEDFRGKLRYID